MRSNRYETLNTLVILPLTAGQQVAVTLYKLRPIHTDHPIFISIPINKWVYVGGGGACYPRSEGGYPIPGPAGTPSRPGKWSPPRPDLGWGTPLPTAEMGYPPPQV